MSNRKYFGTDGIRGKVGSIPITPDFLLKLGWAAGKILSNHGSKRVIIGKDTRNSGYMIESAIEAGLSASGTSFSSTGFMPTPAIAYLTRSSNAEAGIVISASHNLFYDNGIKFFSTDGKKLSNQLEIAIEKEIHKPLICVGSRKIGKHSTISDADIKYIEFCKKTFPSNLNLKGLKIVVDCANGSTYRIAPNILSELGAKVVTIGCQPNGMNINFKCGATDIRKLQKTVLIEKADLGIAYDGDGDRIIMVDHLGKKIDGDQILYIIVYERFSSGKLYGGAVGTYMTNMGLELALKDLGIPFVRSRIGDRNVMKKMQEKGWKIGAESSGHIILLDKTTTGDGIIAGLQVLSAMVKNQMRLYELCKDVHFFPQTLMNIRISKKNNPLNSSKVKRVINKAREQLLDKGRIFLRKSGTEPMIRIMVEGKESEQVKTIAHLIANAIKEAR